MDKDRAAICEIISEMLDNPDIYGIYRTTRAFDKLEALVHSARIEGIGWASANAYAELDAGKDPRQMSSPDILARALVDLAN